jgi:hypothetical protein
MSVSVHQPPTRIEIRAKLQHIREFWDAAGVRLFCERLIVMLALLSALLAVALCDPRADALANVSETIG